MIRQIKAFGEAELWSSRPVRGLALLSAIDAMGTGSFQTGSVVFYVALVGVSSQDIGIALAVAGIVGVIASVLLGHAADRLGPRRLLIYAELILAVLFCGYPFLHGFTPLLVAVSAVAATQAALTPARSALTFHLLNQDLRVRGQALQRSMFNLGFACGIGFAGVALQLGTRTALDILILCNASSYAVCAVIVWRLPRVSPVHGERRAPLRQALADRPFLALTAICSFLLLSESVFFIAIPLWDIQVVHGPRWVISAALLTNTVMVILLQVRVSRGAEARGGYGKLIRRAAIALAASALVLALSGFTSGLLSIVPILMGAALITFCEMWTSAGGWAAVFAHAPAEQQGAYQGVFSIGGFGQMIIGPLFVGVALIPLRAAGWLIVASIALAISVASARVVASLSTTRQLTDVAVHN